MTYRLGYCKTVIWKGEHVFCTAAEEQEAEHICACLNALEGIDLSTLRDGWLADLIQRANMGVEMVVDCRSTRAETHSAPAVSRGARGDHCCFTCEDAAIEAGRLGPFMRLFIVCPQCGNKRCPKATHHDNQCTGSNKPGQPGSRFHRSATHLQEKA